MLAPRNLPGGVQVRYWAFDDDGPAEMPVALETPGAHTDLSLEDAARIGQALLAAAAQPMPDARERLARHLFIDATGGGQLAGNEWGGNSISEYTRNHWLGCADAALAVITGQEN